ncbi:MAG: uridine kinase [Bacteroidota bacterium]
MSSLIIGIAGGTGSGKTTVTEKVVERLDSSDVVVIAHDSYYYDLSHYPGKSPAEINYDHPDALETSLLIGHLKNLREGCSIKQPLYDFSTHRRRSETQTIDPKRIIIVEGILIFIEQELRDLMDVKIFVDTDADERLLRRMKRDLTERGRSIDSIIQQYVSTVKPMHCEFVEPSKRWADIIVPRGGENEVAIDMIITKIRSLRHRQPVEIPGR